MFYRFLLFFGSSVLIAGCATIPPQEVHSAGGVSRITILDSTPHGEPPTRFTIGGGFSRGVGDRDIGEQDDSTDIDLNGEFRIVDRLAVGWQPFYSIMDGSFNSGVNLGVTFYLRWNFLDAGRWSFSLYPGIDYGRNSAESDGKICGLFGCIDDNQSSQSHVEMIDPRLGLITSYYFNDRNFLSFIPTIYDSHESGSYTVNNVQMFAGSQTGLEFSAVLAYGYIFNIRDQHAMVQFSAGAGTHRGFGAYDTDTHITPLIQAGFQYALGKEVPK